MATFDQLSAEQRAIVELILKQGQRYEELGDMLGMPTSRVRELARGALTTLSPVSAAAVDDDWRGQVADYLLNQQSGPEATGTRGHLRRSEAARGWSRSVLDSLEQFYDHTNIPTIPEGEPEAAPRRRERTREEKPKRERRELSPEARSVVRRRRIAGALAALAVLVLVAVLVWPVGLLTGDDDNGDDSADTAQAGGAAGTPNERAVPLRPVEGGGAEQAGLARVLSQDGQIGIVVQAQLPRNANREAYEVWLYNSDTDARSIGAQTTDQRGIFTGAGILPAKLEDFEFIDVSREQVDENRGHSGESVLRGRIADLQEVEPQGTTTSPAP